MPLVRPAPAEERPGRLPLLALAAATVAAHANALGGSFQFDDWNVIVHDPRVLSLGAWWAAMPGMRPLLKLSYALDHALGVGVVGFHAANLLIHVANVLLACALLERLALREGLSRRGARRIGVLGALVFALHPVQTETVAYVSGRSCSLAALFSLVSVLFWILGRDEGRPRFTVLSALSFTAALLVKETALVVPFAILLWEWSGKEGSTRTLPLPHFAILSGAALVAASSSIYRHLLAVSLSARGVVTNLRTQADAVTYLAGQLVRLGRLNADPALPVVHAWSARVALEAASIVALIALGCVLLRRRPALGFGILWFFLWLLPTNSFLPRLDVANDRQLYLALLGPAWLLAWALARARAATLVATALALCVTLGVATHLRNRVYATEIAFWEDVARKAPHNARAFNNLGYAYALASRNEEAEAAFTLALALDPDHTRSGVNLRLLREGALLPPPH